MESLLTAFCLVLVIEGAPYFLFPGAMKRWLQKVPEISDSALRLFGFGAMAVGLLFLFFIRRSV